MRVKNRERPSTWVRLYLYQTVLGQGSFSQMELFSSIWRKHSTDSLRVALFFHAQRLKDSGIHSQILPSPICQDITKQELLTKNQRNFPEMYTYPPPGTNQKNNAWSSKKNHHSFGWELQSALSTHLLRYGHVGGTVLCLAAAGRRGFEGLAEGADGDEALEMLGHKVAI